MRRNIIAVGNRECEGDYNRIMGAGDINILNSKIKNIYIAGNVHITNSFIKKVRVTGDIITAGSTLTNAKLIGNIKFSGICKTDIIFVNGSIFADNLESRIMIVIIGKNGNCNGNISWNGYFKSETLENLGNLSLSFEYDFKNIITSGYIFSDKDISCERFYGFGVINSPAICAEDIILITKKETIIGSLAGSNITIRHAYMPDKTFKSIPKTSKYKTQYGDTQIIKIPQIEGDRISIEYVRSELVSGGDVIIGDMCVIDRVEYKKSISISEKAVVNEVTRS